MDDGDIYYTSALGIAEPCARPLPVTTPPFGVTKSIPRA